MFRHASARPLTPPELATVSEWSARAGDIALTYVSNRLTDDPALYRCVVIVTNKENGPSHLIHAPIDEDVWIAFAIGGGVDAQRFSTLSSALNSIRPVLPDESQPAASAI